MGIAVNNFVLLVDDQGQVEPVLERILKGTEVSISSFTEISAAKRSLIEAAPLLSLALVSFQNDPEGGYRLAREVADDRDLSRISLGLFTDELSEEVIRKASESGAKALIPWPLGVEALKARLKPFLSEQLETGKFPAATQGRAASVGAQAPQMGIMGKSGAVQTDKIQLAQHLLAKALHNLKTSDLLEVIDLEDVPRVVSEITRAVCGVSAPSAAARPPAAPQKTESAKSVPAKSVVLEQSELKTEVDLDAAFGLKK